MRKYLRNPWLLSASALVVIGVGYFIVSASFKNTEELVKVERGEVSEEISIAGKITPAKDVSLGFEKSGRITSVNKEVGDHVYAGEVLVSLSSGDLAAQLTSAEANLAAAEAKLDELKRGARPEEVAIKESAVLEAKQKISTTYATVGTTLESAYISADDAVRKQTDAMFNEDENLNPSLSFQTFENQAQIDSERGRLQSRNDLNSWRTEISGISNSTDTATLDNILRRSEVHLTNIQDFLKHLSDALVRQSNLSATTVTTYQTNITTARNEVSAALSSVKALETNLAAQKISLRQAEDNLALTKAGSSSEAVRVQEAQVAAAKGTAEGIRAELSKNVLRAPISGIITKADAKVGEITTPGAVLISMISDAKFSIEANIPETDVGRLSVGNEVKVVLDAFPSETFKGRVIFIDPAETLVDGVVNFKIKISLDTDDKRIKSGLTANLEIVTNKKEGVLVLPQSAVIQNGEGTFIKRSGKDELVPIKIGLQSNNGKTEIISGLAEGEEVLRTGGR